MREGKYPSIICISGKIASGKTYVSKQLVERNDWSRCSTSEYLRYLLGKQGVSNPTRERLQEQGEEEMKRGWKAFAKSFIQFALNNNPKDVLVVDGVRHIEFLEEVKHLIRPQKCLLIYLESSDEIIKNRLNERGETDIDYSRRAEGNQCELACLADYTSMGNIDNIESYVKEALCIKIARA